MPSVFGHDPEGQTLALPCYMLYSTLPRCHISFNFVTERFETTSALPVSHLSIDII